MLSCRRVEKGVVRKVGFTLTLLSEPTALVFSHRGRGDWPHRSYFDGLPPQADLRQHERPSILPMHKSR